MPLTRNQKEQLVEQYKEGLATAPHAFLLSSGGITVPEITELRAKVRESGGQYVVVKNRLAIRAVEGAALETFTDRFQGPTAVAYSTGDPVALAKVLTDFAKEASNVEFKAGLVEGRPVEGAEIEQIATLPSREELVAKLVFLLQSPITRFVRTLGALPRSIVTVLDQVRQQKETAGSGE